ncbi:MAG: hypothetical protein M1837_004454 [Sclerophora amabilis]|nr:MAG: hypothetical protein M1837_004454 [Sclerophora amabilis]
MAVDTQQLPELKLALKKVLGIDERLLNPVLSELDASRDLRRALQILVEKPDSTPPAVFQRSQLISTILEVTSAHIPLTISLLKQGPSNIQEIASHHYNIAEDDSTIPNDIALAYKERLFSSQPTAVLIGLIQNGGIPIDPPEVKEIVLQCLVEGSAEGFKIDEMSVRTLLQGSKILKACTPDNRSGAEKYLKTLQRLQALVRRPEDIAALLEASYTSAYDVAVCLVEDFAQTMEEATGMEEVVARRIHDHATTVELRNEQAWALGLQQRNASYAPRITEDVELRELAKKTVFQGKEKAVNLSSIFQDMDTVACDACSSVLSPAAYFVDLLRLLQETNSIKGKLDSPTLFSVLTDRRPDLKQIELSCTNTNVTIPYLDLVNEALEAEIDFLNGQKDAKLVPYNMTPDDTNDHHHPQPRHINFKIYQGILQRQMFPLAIFPYNFAIDNIRSLLKACGTSRFEVLATFQSVEQVLTLCKGIGRKTFDSSELILLQKSARTVLGRFTAAEALDLEQEDFKAITGESFQPLSFWSTYQKRTVFDAESAHRSAMGIKTAAHLWGYSEAKEDSENTAMMLDEVLGKGLTFIKHRFLARADISIHDLHELLKTQFIGRRLVITSATASSHFSKKLDDMRLRVTALVDEEKSTLSEELCYQLQAFIRLWKKIGWSISELDAILSTLARNREDASTQSISPRRGIYPNTISELAAVKNMSEMTALSPSLLQPLWGDIDTNDENSLYTKLFLQPQLLALDPIFKPEGGAILKSRHSFLQHKPALLASLSLKEEELASILKATALSLDSLLNLENLSSIYRILVMCKILAISPLEYSDFVSVFNSAAMFSSPTATLKVVKEWRRLLEAGWTLSEMKTVLIDSTTGEVTQQALKAAARLVGGTLAIEANYPLTADAQTLASPEAVNKALTLLFEPSLISQVNQIIEGSQKTTRDVDLSLEEPLGPIPKDLASKLSCLMSLDPPGRVRITLTGLLSASQKAAILRLRSSDNAWSSTIEDLHSASRRAFDVLSQNAFTNPSSVDEIEGTFTDSSDDALNARRLLFLKETTPKLKAQLLQQLVVESVSSDFAMNNSTLILLLTKVLQFDGENNALQTLQAVRTSSFAIQGFSGYFLPPHAGAYRFIVSSKEEPTLFVNHVAVTFSPSQGKWESMEVSFMSGLAYEVRTGGFSFEGAQYATNDSILPAPITADMLLDSESKSIVERVYKRLGAVSKIVDIFNLDSREIGHFSKTSSRLFIDFNNLTLGHLLRLQSYKRIRDVTVLKNKKDRSSLVQFFDWTLRKESLGTELPSKLSCATGWPLAQLSTIMMGKFPTKSFDEMKDILQDEVHLSSLADIFEILGRIKLPNVDVGLLFRLAVPELAKTTELSKDINFKNARSLDLATQASSRPTAPSLAMEEAQNTLRDRRRRAMVQYLLSHPMIEKLEIFDADHLFEYLLIDVQMGPQLQTSRIKQAISTVQLFVQRCMLGLEKLDKEGTKCAGVPAVRWKYMSKYTLWEANRNLFLYPENWIDPTFRDNKTELFKTFESSIMRSNLDMQVINDAVSTYVSGLNDIASLDVRAYFWERSTDTRSTFHFFGRTRQAPFQYYYRSLFANHTKVEESSWTAWCKIEVDIASLETDIDGISLKLPGCYLIPAMVKGRLYLFIPQFMLQTETEGQDKKGFELNIKNETTKVQPSQKYWEIKMAWTELRNGKWSPKRVSQSFLKVRPVRDTGDPPKAPVAPSVSSFRFFVDTISSQDLKHMGASLDDTVVIDVESWFTKASDEVIFPRTQVDLKEEIQRWTVGRFIIRDSQVTVIDVPTYLSPLAAEKATREQAKPSGAEPTNQPQKDEAILDDQELAQGPMGERAFPTHFSKVWTTAPAKTLPELRPGIQRGKDMRHLKLANVIEPSSFERNFTWTPSFQDARSDNPSALVFEVSTRSTRSTYFSLPSKSRIGAQEAIGGKLYLFDHAFSRNLMEFSTSDESVNQLYAYLSTMTDSNILRDGFGGVGTLFLEHGSPYALYTWELGMHVISLLMERLLSTQQFELALSVARLVFDPTVEGSEKIDRCWRFFPFKKIASSTTTESIIQSLDKLEPSKPGKKKSTFQEQIANWRDKPFMPHAVARDRPIVYMKRFVLKYIEILIASGDEYFRQNSLESVPLAIQRYVEASHLFGPAPREVPKLGRLSVLNFDQLKADIDEFSNAIVDMELDFPYSSEPCYRGSGPAKPFSSSSTAKQSPFTGIIKSGYFAVPANGELMKLRKLIDNRFFNIRNSLDINGQAISYSLFDPPLDPGLLAEAEATGIPPSAILNDLDAPMPNYRFYYLLQRAFEMCAELKSLGSEFLAAKEKKDSEGLTMLLARQDILANTNLLPIKQLQKTEIVKGIETLQEQRLSHVTRLKFYLALIGESPDKAPDAASEWTDIMQSIEKPTMDDLRMSSNEKLEMEKADDAASLLDSASTLDLIAAGLLGLPNFEINLAPMGMGSGMKLDAGNLANFMKGTATVMQLKAQMDNHDSQRATRKGQMTRQLQDRRLQANLAGRDIKHTDKEIAVQNIRLMVAEGEIRAQEQQIERSSQIQEWHRSKYTNETLYGWLENSFRRTFYDIYLLAMQLARRAERTFFFETSSRTGGQAPSYLKPSGYWDTSRDGLLAAQNLYLGLKRLEMAYLERRPYDYELAKNMSLRQMDPIALFNLRHNRSTRFSLNEVYFDLDFPGHYFRRIKTVSASIYCVTGRYSGVNCSLSLVENRTRVSLDDKSYEYQGRDDQHFRIDRVPITTVSMTTGQNDAGVFELNMAGERYLPFEGAGVISTWKIEFPSDFDQFDHSTISDIVLHIRYTALDGGLALRKAANASVKSFLKTVQEANDSDENGGGGCFSLLELRNDFSNEWRQMQLTGNGSLKMYGITDRLPFWTRGKQIYLLSILLLVRRPTGAEDWVKDVRYSDGKNDIAFEVSHDVDLGKGMTVLLNKRIGPDVSLRGEWTLNLGESFDSKFFKEGDVAAIVKYMTNL